jgi:aryl-alcohol dehydrogenase-like predicted oxidoreductase
VKSHHKLGLGTVQWGLPYGIANRQGVTTSAAVSAILAEAQHHGITVLDTASQYGEAETVLGANSLAEFCVVSKSPKFATPVISDDQVFELGQVFHQSLQRLSCSKMYGYLIHHTEDLLVPGGDKLVDAMKQLKAQGVVQKIGVSVYDGAQVDDIMRILKPDIIQLPLSVLDQRMLMSGQLERLKKEGVEIHVRSVFLQGLLLMPLNQIPAYFDPIRPLLTRWHTAAHTQGMSLVQAALSFVRDIPYVDTVLIGVESLEQFQSCLEDYAIDTSFDGSNLECADPRYVNPSFWKL